MKKLPGALLFLSAAIYLTVQGTLDSITLLAVIASALCGAVALTRNSIWAMIGGIGLISISFSMQVAMKSFCQTCIRADVLILLAVICLSLVQRGKVKIPSRIMAGVMTGLMLVITLFVSPMDTNSSVNAAAVTATQMDAKIEKLAGVKPVLLFSPNCPACKEIIEALAAADPKGVHWQPVQTWGDDQEGIKYLRAKGYQGEMIFQPFTGAVPALLTKQKGSLETLHGKEQIIKAVQEFK